MSITPYKLLIGRRWFLKYFLTILHSQFNYPCLTRNSLCSNVSFEFFNLKFIALLACLAWVVLPEALFMKRFLYIWYILFIMNCKRFTIEYKPVEARLKQPSNHISNILYILFQLYTVSNRGTGANTKRVA